jgi:regulator of replication initiation timing
MNATVNALANPAENLDKNTSLDLQQEINLLKVELEQKDLLVQQLSEELFRLVKGNTAFLPSTEFHDQHSDEMRFLTEKLAMVENQLMATQAQVKERDREAVALRQEIQEMSDRNRMLEQVVQELPNIYRAKFAERIVPIKQKIESLQKENRQLHIELQSLSFRLAGRTRRPVPQQQQRLELPRVMPALG